MDLLTAKTVVLACSALGAGFVITSYSIHYTKLYESESTLWKLVKWLN